MGVLDWYSSLPPETQQALLLGGMNFAGGLLQGQGQAQMAEANRQLSLQEMLLQLAQQQAQQGLTGTQMNPAAQAQGLYKALGQGEIAKNLRPSSISVPSYMQGAVPQLSGGVMGAIGPNGLPPSVTNALSPQAVLASANQFQQALAATNPNAPTLDLGPTFGQAGTQATQANEKYRQQELARRAALAQATGGGDSGGSGVGSKISTALTALDLAQRSGLTKKIPGLLHGGPGGGSVGDYGPTDAQLGYPPAGNGIPTDPGVSGENALDYTPSSPHHPIPFGGGGGGGAPTTLGGIPLWALENPNVAMLYPEIGGATKRGTASEGGAKKTERGSSTGIAW